MTTSSTVTNTLAQQELHFPHETRRTFRSALPRDAVTSGFLSGIISTLMSALSCTLGLVSRTACRPSRLMFLQKSTLTSSRLPPCSAAPRRQPSVMRTQFSRWRRRSLRQLRTTETTSWSVTWPQPDRLSESRLGHLLGDRQRWSQTRAEQRRVPPLFVSPRAVL